VSVLLKAATAKLYLPKWRSMGDPVSDIASAQPTSKKEGKDRKYEEYDK
jgi:hypothetical protein